MKKTKRIRQKKEELCITRKSPPLKVARYRSLKAASRFGSATAPPSLRLKHAAQGSLFDQPYGLSNSKKILNARKRRAVLTKSTQG
jgi:hypothetical protein